jgi:anti-sigma factor RsiW
MACEQWQAKLDTYLDGELPSDEMRAFDAHVRTCAQCAPLALARVQMKRTIRIAGKQFVPSAEFRSRIRQTTKAPSSTKRTWRLAWVAVVLLILVGVFTAYIGQQLARSERVYSELADLHVATMASSNPVDVVSTDRHTVKPWFQGKLPFTFNLPDLQNSDFTLLGGRVTYITQTPGAHLIYQVRKHEISVFIFPDRTGIGAAGLGFQKKSNFNIKSWREGDLRYFVIGDASPGDIDRLSDLFRTAAKS